MTAILRWKQLKNLENQPILPTLSESTNKNYEKYSVSQCGIKFEAIYIALLCYLVATKKRKSKETILMIGTCSKLKFQTLTKMKNYFWISWKSKTRVYIKNPETTYQNPFRIDNLKLDHENGILVNKLKRYEDLLQNIK